MQDKNEQQEPDPEIPPCTICGTRCTSQLEFIEDGKPWETCWGCDSSYKSERARLHQEAIDTVARQFKEETLERDLRHLGYLIARHQGTVAETLLAVAEIWPAIHEGLETIKGRPLREDPEKFKHIYQRLTVAEGKIQELQQVRRGYA